MSRTRTPAGKVVVIMLLALTGMCALAATACGGLFTIMGLGGLMGSSGGGEFSGALLIIAVPSLLVGGVVTWLCFRALLRTKAAPAPAGPADERDSRIDPP